MTLRELVKRLMEAATDLDDEAIVRIVTRDGENCVTDAEIATVRWVTVKGQIVIERSELQGDVR